MELNKDQKEFLRVNSQLKTGWNEVEEKLVNSNPFNSRNAGQLVNIKNKTNNNIYNNAVNG